MAIPSNMARMSVRATFALDPGTASSLDRLAERWSVSKSEALRRIVRAAAAVEEVDASADALAALEELQARLHLDAERAEAWVRRVREERSTSGP